MGVRSSVLPRDWLPLGISAKRYGLWSKSGNQEFEKSVSECQEGKEGVRSFRSPNQACRRGWQCPNPLGAGWWRHAAWEPPWEEDMTMLPRKPWLNIKVYNIIFIMGNVVIVLNDLWHIVSEFSKIACFMQCIYLFRVEVSLCRADWPPTPDPWLPSTGLTIVGIAILLYG